MALRSVGQTCLALGVRCASSRTTPGESRGLRRRRDVAARANHEGGVAGRSSRPWSHRVGDAPVRTSHPEDGAGVQSLYIHYVNQHSARPLGASSTMTCRAFCDHGTAWTAVVCSRLIIGWPQRVRLWAGIASSQPAPMAAAESPWLRSSSDLQGVRGPQALRVTLRYGSLQPPATERGVREWCLAALAGTVRHQGARRVCTAEVASSILVRSSNLLQRDPPLSSLPAGPLSLSDNPLTNIGASPECAVPVHPFRFGSGRCVTASDEAPAPWRRRLR